MFGLLGWVSAICTAKQLVSEALEKPAPKGSHFDWEAYNKDIQDGVSIQEVLKKHQNGSYRTTKPEPPKWYDLPMDTVVDIERYEHDKEFYGEYFTEMRRKQGRYGQKEKFHRIEKKEVDT